MADDVEVRFGAAIAGAVAGIKQVSEEINHLTAPIREIQKAFSEMGEALIAAFAVEKAVEFIEKMAELGLQTERMSQILGESTTEVQQLGFISKATGGSAEQLARAMELLQVKLQQAQAGTGPAAKALEALGISAKSLIGLSLHEQMDKIADSISRFADGGNKIALVRELFGRMGDTLLPVLNKGSAGLEEMREAAINAGAILSGDTVKALASVHERTVTLSAALTALGGNLVGYFSESLRGAIDGLTDMVTGMNALITGGGLWERAIEDIRVVVSQLSLELLRAARISWDVWNLNFGDIATHWQNGEKMIEDDLAAHEKRMAEIMDAARQKMIAGERATGEKNDKPQAPATPFANTGAQQAAMEGLQAQIHAADEAYRSTEAHLAAEVKLHQITYQEETKELELALSQRLALELDVLSQEQRLYDKGSKEYAKIEAEKTAAIQKAAAERQKIEDKAAEESMKAWDTAGKEIASAVASQNRALLDGTETFGQAFKNIFADMVLKVIAELEKMIIELAIAKIAKIAVFGPVAAIPGFDVGSNLITQSGLAMVHAGNTITPAESAGPYTGGNADGGAGGPSIALNVQAFDAASFHAYFQGNARQLANLLAPHLAQPSLS